MSQDTPMTAPVIELKSIKYFASGSEETHCYNATLYVDGVKWGEVSNDGHGGADRFRGVPGRNYGDIMDLDKRIAATMPKSDLTDIGLPGQTMDQSLEIICGELMNDHLAAKDYKRAAKTRAMFFKEGLPPEGKRGDLYEIPFKGRDAGKMFTAILQKHPGAVVLNMLDEAAAIAAYRRAQ
jgi:hypothetical protein